MTSGALTREIVRRYTLVAALVTLVPATHLQHAHAQLPPGEILVADFEAGPDGAGLLFRVNPATGVRTVVSDFGNPAQGPTGLSPFGVAVLDPATILVVDSQGVSGHGTLFTVNATTGARAIVSDFGNAAQGPIGRTPTGVARGSGGVILVVDPDAGTDVPTDTRSAGTERSSPSIPRPACAPSSVTSGTRGKGPPV